MPQFFTGTSAIFRLLILIIVSAGAFWSHPNSLSAQQDRQPHEKKLDVSQVRAGLPGGIRKFSPGNWGLMKSEVANPSNEAREALSVIYFDVDPGIQFGRRIWVPPNSSRTTWIPVLIPKNIISDEGRRGEFITATANVMLLDQSGEMERVLRPDGRQLADKSFFSVDTEKPITIQIADATMDETPVAYGLSEDKIAGHMLKSMRFSRGFGDTIPNLSDNRAPIVPALFESADQIVVRGNRLANDAPGRTAIRQWVQNGGRLWMMLDTMDEQTCRQLLGDAFKVEYVDRVGLIKFQSKFTSLLPLKTNQGKKIGSSSTLEPKLQEHEHPVQFVRTIVDDCKVVATINGWPSIFKMNLGRGSIVFTTIGARAFLRARAASENPRGMGKALFLPRTELNAIGNVLYAKEISPVVSMSIFAPLVERSIGYHVPGRRLIFVILGAFCLGLMLIGLWLAKSDRLGQLIWVAPVAALAATVPLVAMGTASKHAIPPTVVEAQFIETTHAGDDLYVRGLAGVFHNEAGDRPFLSKSASIFLPDRTGIKDTWRMVWKDLDNWQWENVSMPSGLRLVPYSTTIHSADPMRVYGTFGPAGFVGNLESSLTNVQDVIVASSTHVSLGIELDGDTLSGPTENSLAPGQYTTESLLDDDQIQHQEAYRSLMDFDFVERLNAGNPDEVLVIDSQTDKNGATAAGSVASRKFPFEPSLLAWADAIDLGFEFSHDSREAGSALVVIPIQLLRPEARQTIRIPSVFLPYDSVLGPGNEGKSIAYNGQNGTWPKRTLGTNSTLRFQLPKCVLPFEPTAAKLRIKINAAQRTVDIQSGHVRSLVSVESTDKAMGELIYNITDPEGLRLDENGGLHVRIVVNELRGSDGIFQHVEWEIDFIELEIEGKYSPLE